MMSLMLSHIPHPAVRAVVAGCTLHAVSGIHQVSLIPVLQVGNSDGLALDDGNF